MYLRHYKYDAEYLMKEARERHRQCVQYGPNSLEFSTEAKK